MKKKEKYFELVDREITSRTNIIIFGVILIFTFCYMLFLNIKTPLIADDYVYKFIAGTSTPINSFGDIVQSLILFYLSWGGRLVAELFNRLFMLWGKEVFNVSNSLCYIVFVLTVYFLAVGRKISAFKLLLVTILVWFFTPVFGQTVIWLTGSCNYLWCGTLIVLALLPFRFYEEKQTALLKSKWLAVVLIPLFFMSGITNENSAGAMILIMILFSLLFYKRKIKIPYFAWTGIIFSMISFLCMIFAPGNGMRTTNEAPIAEVTQMVGSNPIITKFSYFAYNLYDLMPLLILAVIAGLLLYKKKDRNILMVFGIFIIAAAAAMFVMLAPPKFPPRAMFGLSAMISIAIVYAVDQLEIKWNHQLILIPFTAVLLYYVMSLGYVGIDAITVFKESETRIEIINENKAEDVIAVPGITPLTDHNGMYGLKDVQMDPNHWVNRALADYYGVKNIVLEP
ncbi:DUF3329 domain-containing protein [Acetobacterium tundrae]|uniref:Glycosyltransferase RgtA/B/C/D-like domain-containing protein n=1 Tax=Acetobacterium tundrae TaxID=132932 RepID=A0ABR6WKQ2_9FIRM|nr:DUF6056 family protein [Acetobacterium tundrae]MBC3796735.1 hypothetical protein [Acetobacterium tundrae]